MARRPSRQQREMVSTEIVDTLLGFIRSHWYQGTSPEVFLKDRSRLLEWVVFEAAGRLDSAFVTLPGERYLAIHMTILREALTHGGRPTYVPAYLRYVVQSHWKIHWETYYEAAKLVTPRVEEVLRDMAAGVGRRPDPVRDLAKAQDLIRTTRRARVAETRAVRADQTRQIDLF